MADVEALCRRVIVIHHGRILYDGDLSGLAGRFSASRTIRATLDDGAASGRELPDLSRYGEVLEREGSRVTIRVPKAESARVAARLLTDLPVADLTIEEPPIEDVIDRVFTEAPPQPAEPEPAP
jgi:ABC-2 type transport system ATP-binding protein